MEGQSSHSSSQYQSQWHRLVERHTAEPTSLTSSSLATASQIPTQLDLLPILLPQHESFHQAQLAHYNKLLASSSGINCSNRTAPGLHASPLPPLLSPHHIQAVPRSRSNSRGGSTTKANKSSPRVGHGNKDSRKPSQGERTLITPKEPPATMPVKKLDLTGQLPNRPLVQHQNSSLSHQSNSVPTTPHQHARNFSFDRDPSPIATNNPSPRSAYSESNITLPSRPPPITRGGCRYETANNKFMRRMPYSIGNDKLEDKNVSQIKSNLTEDEERRLSTEMRELYDSLLPTSQSEKRRADLVGKLEKLFNEEWPGHDIRVHVFGSSGNLLCTDESDVDICITTAWRELESVCMIADLLAKNGMENVVCISYAKVPIVKIWDPVLRLACDMNVNNTLALENTRMIKTYIQIDPRVRPLAMIIKHWTKRRILNDAAFGGTLSSYTWICMIINFLQTRPQPILPNLHEQQHKKRSSRDLSDNSFADDLDVLSSFGDRNKESIGDLLFGFFRFYAYEFDYENLVVSVRHGAQISKRGKSWHLATNNRLCVEEPFNVSRNLANTADDFSWRGLHLELRRAFELISQTKLSECCEQYTIPKVQIPSTTFEKPVQSKKPVLRSASQSARGGRGNHRGGGGRHNHQHGRNASGNRRASSGQYDNPLGYLPGLMPSNLSPQEQWLQQQAQAQLHNDLYATYSVLQAQESNLRMQLYNQSRQYLQGQGQPIPQPQSQGHTSSPGSKQHTERNRTSSFDQPPLSAPIRPQELYYYPIQYQAASLFNSYPTNNTNPSSPSLSHAVPELRRSIHRSNGTPGANAASHQQSALRSHSQPASRPNHVPSGMPGLAVSGAGLGLYQALAQPNGLAAHGRPLSEAPNGLTESSAIQTASSSPDDPAPREYWGYYVSENRQPLMRVQIPAYDDNKQSRRSSIDRLPQSVRDRLQRSSRSPSPLGHDRSHSMSTYTVPTGSLNVRQSVSSTNLNALNNQAPSVANGSGLVAPISIPQWQASMYNNHVVEDPESTSVSASADSMSRISGVSTDLLGDQEPLNQYVKPRDTRLDTPLVVNGSNPTNDEPSISERPSAPSKSLQQFSVIGQEGFSGSEVPTGDGNTHVSPTSRKRVTRSNQNGGVSPLDIGLSQSELSREDLPYLSPVYETRTPSPSANRKFEHVLDRKVNGAAEKSVAKSVSISSVPQKTVPPSIQTQIKSDQVTSKVNGHSRGSKSDGGGSNSWQKAGGKKKKAATADNSTAVNGHPQMEKMPRVESERKGG